MNKKLINVFLGLCVVGLLFITWRSIRDTEDFGAEVTARENVVKSRLMEIRSAEEAYKAQFGEYCADWSVLINFVKTGRLPVVMKQGVLSDKQMDSGLTESKAAEIVNSGPPEESVCRVPIPVSWLHSILGCSRYVAAHSCVSGFGGPPCL